MCHSPRGSVLQHVWRVGGGVGQRVYVICRRGSTAACVTFSYGHLYVSTREIHFGLGKTWSYDIKMTNVCICVILKWFGWLWIGVLVGGSKSWWVLCRTHWGLGETFQTSTDEKGMATGWRTLKMRVFICSWMKPKYPWQELLLLLLFDFTHPGWTFRESPRIRLESAFTQLRIDWIIGFLLPLCTVPPAECPTRWSRVEAATEARQQYLSVWKAAWLSDTTLLGPLCCKSRWGNDVATDMSLWLGKSLKCHQACPVL